MSTSERKNFNSASTVVKGQTFFNSDEMRNEWLGRAGEGHTFNREVTKALTDAGVLYEPDKVARTLSLTFQASGPETRQPFIALEGHQERLAAFVSQVDMPCFRQLLHCLDTLGRLMPVDAFRDL